MPHDFPGIWRKTVEKNLKESPEAPWLEGVEELTGPVTEFGAGTIGEKNTIHIPTTDFEPTVLINNTAYPLSVEDYDDNSITVNLDKYQTNPTSVSDDQIVGASYEQITVVTGSHVDAINEKKYAKAAHTIAPQENTLKTPVIKKAAKTSAALDAAILALKLSWDNLKYPLKGRRLVLSNEDANLLLADRERYAHLFANRNEGTPAPLIHGFQVFQNVDNPYYSSATSKKNAFGTVPTEGDVQATFAFVVKGVAKKTGFTKQYFADASRDPKLQTNLLNYRHYFIAIPKRAQGIGAII